MTEENEENVPIFLSFSDIGVKIGDRQILQNVSGKVQPGEVLAVMGPSGSGKTTLLNVLAGRLGSKTGDILLNGKSFNKKLKRKICYVLQEDIFFANLTLLETLMFSAMLRLPDALSKAEKMKKVQQTVDNLDIRKCLNTKIGSPFERGLSGGEKKRANIGCELITDPSLIFLDEPTSGLDSSNALNLVKTLKNFAAREKKTVVTTIHQPSSQIFYMFDKVLLLCGGQMAYYGKSNKVLNFFESIGLVCDAHFNPADFILEKVTEGDAVQEKIVSGWAERQRRRQTSPVTNRPSEEQVTKEPLAKDNSEEGRNNEGLPGDSVNQIPDNASQRHNQDATNKWENNVTTCNPNSVVEIPASDVLKRTDDGQKLENMSMRSETSGSSSDNELKECSPRLDSQSELFVGIEHKKVPNAIEIPSGNLPPASEGVELSASRKDLMDDSCTPLLCTKPSLSLWRGHSTSKSNDTTRLPVHTEVQLSSADFSVAVRTYRRSTSQDYTKVDVLDHDEDEDHCALYGDISTSWSTSFWTQFTVLLQRTFKQSKPDILSKLNFFQNVLLAVIAGLIWFQLPYKEESIVDRYSLVFFITVYWQFTPLFQSLVSFPNERTVVNKERAAGYYRLSAYYLAKLFSELPLVICQPALFLTIVYWLSGLNRSEAFLAFLVIISLTAITGQSVGLCIGATFMDFKMSIVAASLYGLTCMLLGGFYQKHIPPWLSWIQYTAYITFSYDAALSIEFTDSPPFSCLAVDSSYPSCRNGTLIQGRDVLNHLNVSRTVGQNIAILLLFIVVFRVLAYLSLRYIHRPK